MKSEKMIRGKKLRLVFWQTSMFMAFLAALFFPVYTPFCEEEDTIFTVYVNGINVGTVADTESVDPMLRQARADIASESSDLVFMDVDVKVEGENLLWGTISPEEEVRENIERVMRDAVIETLQPSYTVKINEYTVNLKDSADVLALLQAALRQYDSAGNYVVNLVMDPERELNVLTTRIRTKQEQIQEQEDTEEFGMAAGEAGYFVEAFRHYEPEGNISFEDYDYGLKDLWFGDTVEVVEAYLLPEDIESLDEAVDEVLKEQEKMQIYEVQAGDTLGGISYSNNLSIEELLAMNPEIESENSIIREGQEIIVTVPEPELSMERTELEYYEESYDAPVQYVDNDEWYTTKSVTLQEPSAGFHKVAVEVSYRNNQEVGRNIIKEEVVIEAVPKIEEKGTKIPPTYIRPIYGGRVSSGYGRRSAPTKGASTNHQGTDFATPIGTQVMASSAGTVTRAGWASGYGYLICIQHPDGRETRYGHLSKILVSVGQKVQQGQKIALSGNTGRSTGPHLHFEIRIDGKAVNALNYIQ